VRFGAPSFAGPLLFCWLEADLQGDSPVKARGLSIVGTHIARKFARQVPTARRCPWPSARSSVLWCFGEGGHGLEAQRPAGTRPIATSASVAVRQNKTPTFTSTPARTTYPTSATAQCWCGAGNRKPRAVIYTVCPECMRAGPQRRQLDSVRESFRRLSGAPAAAGHPSPRLQSGYGAFRGL
jgi:hypothetical protein